jgi:dihydroflavonol-4-reductase
LLLDKGWEVRALVRSDTRALEGLDIDLAPGDVLDKNSLRIAFASADVVFHLAGRISIVGWDCREVEAINTTGVSNVVDACLRAKVKRLVHASSFHACCQHPLEDAMDETRPLLDGGRHPPYNRTKARGEKILMKAIRDGLDAVITSPTGMLGPNDFKPSHFGATLIALAKGRMPALVSAGLDWVDTRDVADGMLAASQKAECGSKYMLSGHWCKLTDIASHIYRITGVKPPRLVLPLPLAKAVSPLAELYCRASGSRPLFTPISMQELESNSQISHDKASRELGYNPRPLEETLDDTIRWFQTHGFLN